jgi:hypothetical protein
MSDQTTAPRLSAGQPAETGARLRRRANIGALILAALWLALVAFTLTPDVDDFKQFWQASVNVRQTGDPYATTPDCRLDPARCEEQLGTIGYFNPPIFAYLLLPLSLLSQTQGQYLWFGLNCLALAGLVWLSLRLAQAQSARVWWGVLVCGALLAPPTRLSLQLGQLSIALALMLVAGFALAPRRPLAAGGLLALAGMVKLYPFALGAAHLLRRQRRVLLGAAAAVALLLAATLLAYGPLPYQRYLERVLLGNFYPYAAEHNISLFGFWRRLLSTSRYAVPLAHLPALATALAALSSLAVLGLCLRAGRGPDTLRGARLQYSMWLCAMLLLSPVNGYYNLVLLIFPLLALLRELELRPDPRLRNLLALATALVCIPPTWTDGIAPLHHSLHIGWGLLLLTPSLYGLLLYVWLLAKATVRG